MSGAAPRPPSAYIHGIEGPAVVVPARVAAWLERHADLRRLRTDVRGGDPEVDAVLVALSTAAAIWRGSVVGTEAANQPEPAPQSLTTAQAAQLLRVSSRAVIKQIAQGRLPAEQVAGRWLIRREDVEHLRAARAA